MIQQRPEGDPLGRFYTRPSIGDALVALMGDAPPRRILDLGAGDGALSRAARQRWSQSDIVTVDCVSAFNNGSGAISMTF